MIKILILNFDKLEEKINIMMLEEFNFSFISEATKNIIEYLINLYNLDNDLSFLKLYDILICKIIINQNEDINFIDDSQKELMKYSDSAFISIILHIKAKELEDKFKKEIDLESSETVDIIYNDFLNIKRKIEKLNNDFLIYS